MSERTQVIGLTALVSALAFILALGAYYKGFQDGQKEPNPYFPAPMVMIALPPPTVNTRVCPPGEMCRATFGTCITSTELKVYKWEEK